MQVYLWKALVILNEYLRIQTAFYGKRIKRKSTFTFKADRTIKCKLGRIPGKCLGHFPENSEKICKVSFLCYTSKNIEK